MRDSFEASVASQGLEPSMVVSVLALFAGRFGIQF